MLVYKHLGTFEWSIRVRIQLFITIRFSPQMLAYKHLGTFEWSARVTTYLMIAFRFLTPSRCLYTSIWGLLSDRSE